jgi:hypothetical protein
MGQTDGTVSCTGCSRSYKWKPELAGRKAKCKCGTTVQFPKEAPAAAPRELDLLDPPPPPPQAAGEYDLHDTAKPAARSAPPRPAPVATGRRASADADCIDCGKPLPPGAVLCLSCGMNQKTGRKLDTAVEKPPMALAAARAKAPVKSSGGLAKWIWIGGAVVAAGAAVLVAMFVFPEISVKIFAGIGIAGLIIFSLGMWWATYVATADNLGLRLACRYVPFVGIIVVITRSISSWDEMKAPVITLFTGMVIGVAGLVLYLGTAAHAAGIN